MRPGPRNPTAAMAAGALCAIVLALAPTAMRDAAAVPDPEIRPWAERDAPIAPHLAPDTWTLVMIWSVTCQICAAETPAISAFYREERERGVRVLGVSIDGPGLRAEVAQWMKDHQMAFPTLLGDLPAIASYFAAATEEPFRGTPTFLIFDPEGRIVGVNAGAVRIEALRSFLARKRGAAG